MWADFKEKIIDSYSSNLLVSAPKIGKMMIIFVEWNVYGFFCIPWGLSHDRKIQARRFVFGFLTLFVLILTYFASFLISPPLMTSESGGLEFSPLMARRVEVGEIQIN